MKLDLSPAYYSTKELCTIKRFFKIRPKSPKNEFCAGLSKHIQPVLKFKVSEERVPRKNE